MNQPGNLLVRAAHPTPQAFTPGESPVQAAGVQRLGTLQKDNAVGTRSLVGTAGLLASLLWLLLCPGTSDVSARQSVLYGGDPLYVGAAANRETIRSSGFTTLVIWTIHVSADGSLALNNHLIVQNGAYVGRADWPTAVAAFKTGSTSVSRVELGLSGHESQTFLNIRDLVFSQGTGTNGILYRNFKVLRDLIPAIDGINYDEESHLYDENVAYTMEQFSLMLADLGFNIELDVFCCSEVWTAVFNAVNGQHPGTIDRVDLQCYAGGGGNDPCWWSGQFGGLRVTPGLWAYPSSESGGYWARTPSQVQSQMSDWNASCSLAGGFMWYLDDMLLATNLYPVSEYGSAINDALGIDPTRGIAGVLCEHTDYYGWTVEAGRGPYGALEISAAGGQIDQLSSLKVKPGWKVTLYSEANFSGDTLVVTSSDSSLVDEGWNDRVQSLTVLPLQDTPVTLYQHIEYVGWAGDFDVGAYTSAQIMALGGLDDEVSSMEISPGYRVTLYEYDNFQGRTLVKTADDPNLVNDGWNDIASSMRVEVDPKRWRPVTLYQDAAYSGWSADFGVGAYTLNQIGAAGGMNDDATSVKIAPGYTVTFYRDDNFEGATLVKTNDDVCLYDDGFNDVISSMVVNGPTNESVPVSLLAAGSAWNYFDQTNDLGTAWRSNAFNDATWPNGPARLGYGGDGEITSVGDNGQWTTYFRTHFFVPDPDCVSNLNIRFTRDDAVVIYLNGSQLYRDTNLPAGVITNQTPALASLEGIDEKSLLSPFLPATTRHLLIPGWNLLAAEVHNQSPTNGDLGIDIDLAGTTVLSEAPALLARESGPDVTLTWPGYANGFATYSTTNLLSPIWTRITNEPTLSNGAWIMRWPSRDGGQRFFRLQPE